MEDESGQTKGEVADGLSAFEAWASDGTQLIGRISRDRIGLHDRAERRVARRSRHAPGRACHPMHADEGAGRRQSTRRAALAMFQGHARRHPDASGAL